MKKPRNRFDETHTQLTGNRRDIMSAGNALLTARKAYLNSDDDDWGTCLPEIGRRVNSLRNRVLENL